MVTVFQMILNQIKSNLVRDRKEYDHGDGFAYDFETNRIQFVSKLK